MNDMSNKWIGKNTIRPDGANAGILSFMLNNLAVPSTWLMLWLMSMVLVWVNVNVLALMVGQLGVHARLFCK